MTTPAFDSRALEMNLAETNKLDITLSGSQEWFASISEEYVGIHERAQTFLRELNHPYPDYAWLAESIRKICIGDFWFYSTNPHAVQAFHSIVEFFSSLLDSDLSNTHKVSLFRSLVQFLDRLLGLPSVPHDVAKQIVAVLETLIEREPTVFLPGTHLLRTIGYPQQHDDQIAQQLTALVKKTLQITVSFWSNTSDTTEQLFANSDPLKRQNLPGVEEALGIDFIPELSRKVESTETWEQLVQLPMHADIADSLRDYTSQLSTSLEQLQYLYYSLHLPGMSHLEAHLLRDIQRLLRQAFFSVSAEQRESFVDSVFSIFEEFRESYMSTVLDGMETMGIEIVKGDDAALIETLITKLIGFGFVHPGEIKVGSDWQVVGSPTHIKNIRVWLAIIECNPVATKRLLAALVIHLRQGGVFIQDTDLFQKDITRLLNADIAGVYATVNQLAILFPVYYSEIGAEGELREVTNELDGLCGRRDKLIHLLRKQVHAESNNTNATLTYKIVEYWYTADPAPLLPYLPEDVAAILYSENPYLPGVHTVMHELHRVSGKRPEELFDLDEPELNAYVDRVEAGTDTDQARVRLIFKLAWLLHEKYSIGTRDVIKELKKYNLVYPSAIDELEECTASDDKDAALGCVFGMMETLRDTILDPSPSEGWENIYYKRHIAAGIPSMYGRYHEKKYEALGLTLRLEHTAGTILEGIIKQTNLHYMSIRNLKKIARILQYFLTGLSVRGIYNKSLESNINMLRFSLKSESFSIHQYINIFHFLIRNVREIINHYFISVYDEPLKEILKQKHADKNSEAALLQRITQDSETFYRDTIGSCFFIQALDSFLGTVLRDLRETRDTIPQHLLPKAMTYNPEMLINRLDCPDPHTDNKVFLGAKAFFLKELTSFGFPIPPGFVLTTELFRHQDVVLKQPQMEKEVEELIRFELGRLERQTGLEFGSAERPLLLSVRSGSAFPMPGAMATFLNVGINREIAETLTQKPEFAWAAWDCYRRLLQSWGMAHGIERDEFDAIMRTMKSRHGIDKKRNFSPAQMRELCDQYFNHLGERSVSFVDDPFMQLKQAVLAVIKSWSSNRARLYRQHLQIADDWGTAVLIQRMIFGNLNNNSGTGVVFTQNPQTGRTVKLYGDYIPCNQGEDVVSGVVHTLPITVDDVDDRDHKTDDDHRPLQEAFPTIYRKLTEYANKLIDEHSFPHQEIEFTFETPDELYVLQTRPQVERPHSSIMVFDNADGQFAPAGRGIGVGGEVLNGLAAFDMEDIAAARQHEPERNCVLLRPDTVPDDIELVFACDGLLTARGGVTSHAAVTAVQLGIVCVVNCRDLVVDEQNKRAELNGVCFEPGDEIAIDGINGNIYKGNLPLCTRTGQIVSQ